jgi:hypothetical protein
VAVDRLQLPALYPTPDRILVQLQDSGNFFNLVAEVDLHQAGVQNTMHVVGTFFQGELSRGDKHGRDKQTVRVR